MIFTSAFHKISITIQQLRIMEQKNLHRDGGIEVKLSFSSVSGHDRKLPWKHEKTLTCFIANWITYTKIKTAIPST